MSTPTSPYAAIAADLHAIAAAIADLSEHPNLADLYVSIDIQPRTSDDDTGIATVDALAGRLFGTAGQNTLMSGGTFHHTAKAQIGDVKVSVYTAVTPPAERAKAAELADLRKQLAAAQAELAARTPDPGDDPADRYRPGDRVGIDLASGGTLRGQVVNWHSRSNTGNGWQPGYLVHLDGGVPRWFAVDRVRLLATDPESAAVAS